MEGLPPTPIASPGRDAIMAVVNPEKTELIVYLNGLDESYFPEAWDRMVYFGNIGNED